MLVGDHIVVNLTTTTNNNSKIFKILKTASNGTSNSKNNNKNNVISTGWIVEDIITKEKKKFKWVGFEDRIMKIKNIFWLNFINSRDPWDFITKMQEFHELFSQKSPEGPSKLNTPRGAEALDYIIENRDYEIMNYNLNQELIPVKQEIVDKILKSGDLQMMNVLAEYNIFASPEMLSWAINNNLTKIIIYLLNQGLIPDIKDINWACKNSTVEIVELIMIAGYFPDTAGTQYLLDSGDLYKEALVKIFDLKVL